MKKRRIPIGRTGLALLALLVVAVALVFGTRWLEKNQLREEEQRLTREAVERQKLLWTDDNTLYLDGDVYGFDHRIETFLFIGTDNTGGENIQVGSAIETHQPMADFVLLMILDHTKNSISYLQIDRNTVVKVRDLDKEGNVKGIRPLQLCTAHWYGRTPEMAANNLSEAVKDYLGEMENIDGYYVINMSDIELLNEAVGGVQVTMTEDLTDRDPAFTKGATVTLTGGQAEAFLRMRMNVGSGTNVERMGRQREYMSGLFASVRDRCLEDARFAVKLWDTLRSIAFTNMNGTDFSRIAQKLLKGDNQGIHTIRGETREGYLQGDGIPHEEFYPDETSVKETLIELFSLVPVEEDEDEEEDEEVEDGSPEDETEDEEDESEDEPATPTDLETAG